MLKHPLEDMLEPVVSGLGYEMVRVMTIGQVNPTLQIMIDLAKEPGEIDVEDCAKVSRAVSALLDEKDPLKDKYVLEVSSPGIDRPLTKPKHFDRFKGNVVKIETSEPVDGRKRFKGDLLGIDADNKISISVEQTVYEIAFDLVSKAKIVLTDELWAKYQAEHQTDEL